MKPGILDAVAKEGSFEEVAFEQRPEWSKGERQADAYGKSNPERGPDKDRRPEREFGWCV